MSQFLEEISPSTIRERKLSLTLEPDANPAANQSLLLNVDYSDASPEGVVLPLILEVQGPTRASYVRRVFRRTPPSSIVITPKEGGRHLVTLREAAHNRWWGSIQFEAQGSELFLGDG